MKKNRRQYQRGFTLIELLVVIAILAVLFGVTALALNGVGANAEQNTACAERDIVQTSLDVYMAETSVATVTVGSGVQVTAGTAPAGTYLRRNTRYYYSWDSTGLVNNVVTSTTKTFTCP
jgi:prepilin-type N-terminal cleavage/methylation domain-containing protein